jgi:hypothetical protein
MYGKSISFLPVLTGADISIETSGDLLPGLKEFFVFHSAYSLGSIG